jgi:hypothetical protein
MNDEVMNELNEKENGLAKRLDVEGAGFKGVYSARLTP